MNDITALSPVTPEMLASMKLSAMNLAEGEMMSIEPAVFRALVEALEKAQQQVQTHERAELTWMNALELPDKATRNDILPAIHAEKYALRAATKRIAELESRTVTVKLPAACADDEYFNDGVFQPMRYERDVERALRAAGIQVIEGEGQ